MSHITWLHLSDFHFRESDIGNAKIVLSDLLRDIVEQQKKHDLQLDFIAVTGDIAFASRPEEYNLAHSFLDDLLSATELGKDRLFIVPGNHDVDRKKITKAASLLSQHIHESPSKEELRDRIAEALDSDREVLFRRFHQYAAFVNSYLAGSIMFDDTQYFYTKTLSLGGIRVAILGLNTAWLSETDQESKMLVLGEEQVRTALTQARGTHLRIVLMHHPFDWLHEYDQDDLEPLLKDSVDFILRGHLHKSKSEFVATPDSETLEIAAGACFHKRSYPNSYNLVQLNLDTLTSTIILRRYVDERGGFWAEDNATYRNVPDGVYMFLLTKRLAERLKRHSIPSEPCLDRIGLRENPFALWNAESEREPDLSGYFMDIGRFYDELLCYDIPCVVLSDRGLGKTAYRKMVEAECYPIREASPRLTVSYSYGSFEQLLEKAEGDPTKIRPIDYVNELLRQGLGTIEEQALDGRLSFTEIKRATLGRPRILRNLYECLRLYAPEIADGLLDGVAAAPSPSSVDLLKSFSGLLEAAGFSQCVVLFDGLDEWRDTVDKPALQVALLAPLLGTWGIVGCQGFAFKFFLQQSLETILFDQDWFRPDRVQIFRIPKWDEAALQSLIGQRLNHFSQKGSIVDLAQLCEDNLAKSIGDELAHEAEGRPRWAIILADMLLSAYCQEDSPPAQITQDMWDTVKKEWPIRRIELLKGEMAPKVGPGQDETIQVVSSSQPLSPDQPLLYVDEERDLVMVGGQDITAEISTQQHLLIKCLYRHRGTVCAKDQLIHEAWPEDEAAGVTDQAIATAIKRLREKLKEYSQAVEFIETIRGRGYRLHPESYTSWPVIKL
jgi:predicted MPP superfamily phosphohydrolase